MIFYGIASSLVREVIQFFPTRETVEGELEQIVRDEPSFASVLSIEAVDFSIASMPAEGPALR